jgi:hypothetical protein
MIRLSIRGAAAATILAVTAASSPLLAQAASFEGPWSVLVQTTRGNCDPSNRFGIMVRGGAVHYLGGGAVNVSGRVSPSGQVSVSVSSGGQSAHGSGRLANGRGSGTWRGQGNAGTCSGVWSASQG